LGLSEGVQVKPTLIMFTLGEVHRQRARRPRPGIGVITVPTCAWTRRDIKSVRLLAQVLATPAAAAAAGAGEAWSLE